MAESEQQDPPLPSPSYCRHTLYQSITDTVNTSVSQYYLVIPQYYDIYRINNIYEIFLLFVKLVTYFPCYHPQRLSNSTPDIWYKALEVSQFWGANISDEKVSWGEVEQDMSS